MTAVSELAAPGAVIHTARYRGRRLSGKVIAPLLPPLGLAAGSVVVAWAYADAATGSVGDLWHFHRFWIGMALFVVPVLLRLCAARVTRGERLALVVATGLFDYLPKYLRGPGSPLYHDELAHWRQSEVTYATGQLFQPNPTIPILRSFPGLHALTVALRDLTGLGTFDTGVILPGLLHVVALLGIFVLAEQVTLSARVAALAALLYSFNPSFLFFDAEYAYESLGIVLCIWVVVALVAMQRAADDRPRQLAWFSIGLALAAACVVTHHLSSFIAVAVSIGVAIATTVGACRGTARRSAAVLACAFAAAVAILAAAWVFVVATDVWNYLTPYLAKGSAELAAILHHRDGARQLFALSVTPGYERLAAYLAPAIAALGAIAGLWPRQRRGPHETGAPAAGALVLFGLLYFPSVPFVLTEAGNEGARRSWAFTYIGLVLLVAPVIPCLMDGIARLGAVVGALARGTLAALLMVLLVGNVSAFTNETYRFPGPYVYGSDVRSLTPELLAATRWVRDTQGVGNRVVADRFSALALASFGKQWPAAPSTGFPAWQLYFSTRRPSAMLLGELRTSRYDYLVVDRRMARYLPRIGVYFEPDEPQAYRRVTPPPAAALDRYERMPWSIKLYQSENLAIYRLNFHMLDIPWRQGRGRPGSAKVRTPWDRRHLAGTRLRPRSPRKAPPPPLTAGPARCRRSQGVRPDQGPARCRRSQGVRPVAPAAHNLFQAVHGQQHDLYPAGWRR